jgi:hypothetical protein
MIVMKMSEGRVGRWGFKSPMSDEFFEIKSEFIYTHRHYEKIPLNLIYAAEYIYSLEDGEIDVIKHRHITIARFSSEDAMIAVLKGQEFK